MSIRASSSRWLRWLACALLLLAAFPALARQGAPAKPMTLSFGGVQYVHRWSQKGQNEFTPPAETDLSKWRDMVTLNLHDKVTTGDQLAQLANGVLGNYEKSGKILRTDSKPRTPGHEAEHLVVAILSASGVMEAVFARVMMVEGKGVVVVYSHRAYGKDPAAVVGPWLQSKGQSVETTLMAWKGIPKLAAVRALPQGSHMYVPSSRWKLSTGRLPLMESSCSTRLET